MSFHTQATLAEDYHILRRIASCAASEGVKDPMTWAAAHAWEFSAQPGWDTAYEAAIATGNMSPGSTNTVITDHMILAAVQLIRPLDVSSNV